MNGTTIETWMAHKELDEFYNVITVSNDDYNKTYVSTFEAKKYPFYGIMYHVEKSLYGFGVKGIPHGEISRQLAEDMAFFFVSECAKST